MITLNKSMIILPHEKMMKKLEETKIQRMNLFGDLNQYMGSNQIKPLLERNENGRPILILKELEKTAINTPTQESYDTLMQIYECGNWKWQLDNFPTENNNNNWGRCREDTCITTREKFQYGNLKEVNTYGKGYYKIITPQEFYELQEPEITQEIIQEINEWFEINKPNRESKG